MTTGTLLAISLKKAARQPMVVLPGAEITKEEGIAGDARGRPGPRQVTIVSREAWERACDTLGTEVPWTARRANLLVEGFDFENSQGRVLQIGPVRLEITGETLPCARMDEAQPGLRSALEPEWRGGVTAMVLTPGRVGAGDPVRWDAPAPD